MALQINIITPGKHSREILPLLEKYHKQISRFADINWHLVATGSSDVEINSINSRLKSVDFILCDERGDLITTSEISKVLERQMVNSKGSLNFVIGGAYGVNDEIRRKAKTIWSFGKVTMPLQLVRVIICEQLYRASTILQNHPYHHAN